MTAISADCRIVSLRQSSGRRLSLSRNNQDFSRNRAPRRTLRNRSRTDRLTSQSVRAEAIAEALRPGRIARVTGFRTEVRDPTAPTKSAMRGIATIDKDATVVPGISGPIAIPSQRVKPAQTRQRRRGFRPS
jgi:hypothetical protein